ncbi:uncharacterized protein LOC111519221 [Drosophila willistoni]|uniref:uncharacterized protein LOC111519221 n=1 Tax=Drosophila willistoni TaxID=7260 RepID=UPI00017D889D|nr:uncharacterized protein LOC111519221 [Drosophila willistoni]
MALCKYHLTPEKLDEKFDKAVERIIWVISQLTNKDLIMPIWTRWLQIFKQSSKEEKFSRNYMLLELNKQLHDDKTLGFPFTEDQNCNIDLSTLHQMMVEKRRSKPESSVNNGDDNQTYNSDDSDSMATICTSNPITGRIHDCDETENRRLLEEIEAVAIELQEQQLRHELLQKRYKKYQEILKALTRENKYLDKQLAYIKQVFSWSSVASTKVLNTNKAMTVTPQYFVTLFSVLCETREDMACVKALDYRFKKLIDSHINNYLRKKRGVVLQNMSKEYDVLKAAVSQRYKKVMRLQIAAEEKELSLMAMRYLALLRMIFLSSYKGSKSTIKAVIKFFHDRNNEISVEM